MKNNILLSEEYINEKITKSIEYKNNVNIFCVNKDKNNNIYLIHNDFSGNVILNYYLFSCTEKIIKKINPTEENIKSLLSIKIGLDLHIFYVIFFNKTGKYSFIHQRIYNDIINSETVIDTISPDYTDVCAQWDKDNYIYVIYKNTEVQSYIIKRYNLSSNSYDDYKEELNYNNLLSFSFHITSKKLAIILLTQRFKDKSLLLLIKKELTYSNGKWSSPIEISSEVCLPNDFSIADDTKNIYITYKELGFIMCKIYNYEKQEWIKNKVLTVDNDKIVRSTYIDVSDTNNEIKSNFIYSSVERPLLNILKLYNLDTLSVLTKDDNTIPFNNSQSLVSDRDKKVFEFEQQNIYLKNKIKTLTEQLSKYNKDSILYKAQFENYKDKYNSLLLKLNGQIEDLYSQKDKITIEMCKETTALNTIIDDKDKLIDKLTSLISNYGIKNDS